MKRFWKDANAEQGEQGWRILLDDRPLRTPARAELVVPGQALADVIVAEWSAVDEDIDPTAMPMTGYANAAIDRVGAERAAFLAEIVGYANADMLCYRADFPQELAKRQAERWEPLLDWARTRFGVAFTLVSGIMHVPQPEPTLARLRERAETMSDFELAAMAKIVSLSGSAVAALALLEGAFDAESVWQASLIDELWQEDRWGDDDFALKQRADRAADFMAAARFLKLVQTGGFSP